MPEPGCSWRDPRFTYADALTGARLLMLPYLLYGLAVSLPGLAVATLLAMIGTDLVDGTIARRTGQRREVGAIFDSTVDFLVIYSVFTTLFIIGVLPWWKWLVIFAMGLLIAGTQILSVVLAKGLTFAPVRFGKLVGQLQFVYLPFLLVRAFWVKAGWAQTVDDVLFGLLVVAIVASTVDHVHILRRLMGSPRGASGTP